MYSYKFRQIHLITTARCNLHCTYCYEHSKGGANMNCDRIKDALAKDFSLHKDFHFLISFHGGEPFLAFAEIKEICEWIWRQPDLTEVLINIVTNGTVLNQGIKEWIREKRRKVVVVLSIDGLPEVHNKNRCNSYNRIDLDFFKSVYKRPEVKMTVPPSALPYLADGFEYLYGLGMNPTITLAAEQPYTDDDVEILAKQLVRLIGFYKSHFDVEVTELLYIPFEKFSLDYVVEHDSLHRCGIGQYRAAYDLNGNEYPCQTFIADLEASYDSEKITDIKRQLTCSWKEIQPECKDCIIAPVCSSCYGLNWVNRGNIGNIDSAYCKMQKVLIQGAASLWAYILSNMDKYPWIKNMSSNLLYHKISGIKELKNKLYGSATEKEI